MGKNQNTIDLDNQEVLLLERLVNAFPKFLHWSDFLGINRRYLSRLVRRGYVRLEEGRYYHLTYSGAEMYGPKARDAFARSSDYIDYWARTICGGEIALSYEMWLNSPVSQAEEKQADFMVDARSDVPKADYDALIQERDRLRAALENIRELAAHVPTKNPTASIFAIYNTAVDALQED